MKISTSKSKRTSLLPILGFMGASGLFLWLAAAASSTVSKSPPTKSEIVIGSVSPTSPAPFRGKLTIFFGTRIGRSYSVEWLTEEQARKARENPNGYKGPTGQTGTLDPAEIVAIERFDGSSWSTTTA